MRFGLGVLSLLAPAAISAAPPPAAGTLTVVVSNVRAAKGRVHLDVCPEAKFLKDGCPYAASAVARAGVTIVVVNNVRPGRYAVQAFLDENINDKVDRNFLGIPKEGFGFSNNPSITFSAPSFESAAFIYSGGNQTIQLRLKYIL